ncbi:hypothetical protein D1872_348920 [compost metagenome]
MMAEISPMMRNGGFDPGIRDQFMRVSAGFLGLCHGGAPETALPCQSDTAPSPSRHTSILPCGNF